MKVLGREEDGFLDFVSMLNHVSICLVHATPLKSQTTQRNSLIPKKLTQRVERLQLMTFTRLFLLWVSANSNQKINEKKKRKTCEGNVIQFVRRKEEKQRETTFCHLPTNNSEIKLVTIIYLKRSISIQHFFNDIYHRNIIDCPLYATRHIRYHSPRFSIKYL